jgi:hypothetical protein
MIEFTGLFDTGRDYILQLLLHTHTSVHSHVFTSRCLVTASNCGLSPSSGFPKYPRPQLPASHSNCSQRLNLSSPLSNSLTHQPTTLHLTQLTEWLNAAQVKVMLRPTVSWPVCLGVKPHLGPKTRFLLLSDSWQFVHVYIQFRQLASLSD